MSDLEDELIFLLRVEGLPAPEREVVFHPPRRWRFDLAWPPRKLAAEVEGGVWSNGRHTRGSGFTKDCEKYNAAALDGWRVLRFTGQMIHSGAACETIRRALGAE